MSLKIKRLKASNDNSVIVHIDMLFLLFKYLDYKSLLTVTGVCKLWRGIYLAQKSLFWKNLSLGYGISTDFVDKDEDWLMYFKTQRNLHLKDNYKFVVSHENFSYKDNVEYETYLDNLGTALFVWPCSILYAYKIALDRTRICWLDSFAPQSIFYGQLKSMNEEHAIVVEGALTTVGENILILSNGLGRLLAFDEKSKVNVFNMDTLKLMYTLDPETCIGSPSQSMNVRGNRLVTGHNGFLAVWNIETSDLIIQIPIPELNNTPLNVAVWENYVTFGGPNGEFYVYDTNNGEIINKFDANSIEMNDEPNSRIIFNDLSGIEGLNFPDLNNEENTPSPLHTQEILEETMVSNIPGYDLVQPSFSTVIDQIPNSIQTVNQSSNLTEIPFPTENSFDQTSFIQNTLIANLPPPSHISELNQMISNEQQILPPVPNPLIANLPQLTPPFHFPDSIEFTSNEMQQPQTPTFIPDSAPPIPGTIQLTQLQQQEQQQQQHEWNDLLGEQDEHAWWPVSLAINSHILITNSIDTSKIIVWDIKSGEPIQYLSQELSCNSQSLYRPRQPLKLVEFSNDGTIIYGSNDNEINESQVIVWDFEERKRQCSVFTIGLPCSNGFYIDVWVSFEVIEKTDV